MWRCPTAQGGPADMAEEAGAAAEEVTAACTAAEEASAGAGAAQAEVAVAAGTEAETPEIKEAEEREDNSPSSFFNKPFFSEQYYILNNA